MHAGKTQANKKIKNKEEVPQEATVFVSDNEILRDFFGLCLLDLSSAFIFLSFFFFFPGIGMHYFVL